ncbi:MAG: bifunctional nicotinamidase/pyrazinamidase [Polyangiales bacterium]
MAENALLLIDLQNDFCAHGALEVPGGDDVVPIANALMPRFSQVVATADAHPPTHLSFASNHSGKVVYEQMELDGLTQVLWPDHCVAGTPGAALHPKLNRDGIHRVVEKGTDPRIDSYSGFFDNGHRKQTALHDYLQSQGVKALYVMGLATDFCVKWSVLDALRLGYRVHLVQDGCRGVGLAANDVDDALSVMREAGATFTSSAEVLSAMYE